MWAGFFCRQDVSISIFGHTKESSEVRGTTLMCNFGVRSRFLDVIYGVRPPNGSPANVRPNWGCMDKMSEVNFSPAESLLLVGKSNLGFH